MSFGYNDFKDAIERLPNYKVQYVKKDMLSKTRGPTMRVNVMQITRPITPDDEET
jgi:ribosomal protein L1